MQHPAEPTPIPAPQGDGSPNAAQVKKARMLVSMLGADFAKTSKHPFFKDLAKTAVHPLDKSTSPPDMSKALANLVRRLAEPKTPRRVASKGIVKPEAAQAEQSPATQKEADIMTQHPALIAKHLIGLPTAQQLAALRKLRGPAARQVAAYISELRKSSAT